MNATTENHLPAGMKASDSDRDAVVSDLSEHFQAGRLTAEEFEERTGRALAARTWGELRNLLADLPAARPGSQAASQPRRSPARCARAPLAALVCAAIVGGVLLSAAHGGWGLIWLVVPVLLIARRSVRCARVPGRSGPQS
jgi:hypothetical protein